VQHELEPSKNSLQETLNGVDHSVSPALSTEMPTGRSALRAHRTYRRLNPHSGLAMAVELNVDAQLNLAAV